MSFLAGIASGVGFALIVEFMLVVGLFLLIAYKMGLFSWRD